MDKKVLIAAHRGFMGGNIPCNTLLAFKSAVKQGADVIELDVVKSTDGTMWVFHDGNEFPHLNINTAVKSMSDEEIKKITYFNCGDRCRTLEPLVRLDDALDYLKTRALVNVDRSWDNLPETVEVIKRCKAEECVIIKSPAEESRVDDVERFAPELKYMPIIKSREILDYARTKKINLFGAEVLFETEDNELCSDKFIDEMHARGEKIWVNAIDINFHLVFAAHRDDTVSLCDDPERGWGWLMDKGFDIIQTDFPYQLNDFRNNRKVI